MLFLYFLSLCSTAQSASSPPTAAHVELDRAVHNSNDGLRDDWQVQMKPDEVAAMNEMENDDDDEDVYPLGNDDSDERINLAAGKPILAMARGGQQRGLAYGQQREIDEWWK